MFYCKPYLPFSCCNLKDVCEERKNKRLRIYLRESSSRDIKIRFQRKFDDNTKERKVILRAQKLGKANPPFLI
jgi:hypothetical protein